MAIEAHTRCWAQAQAVRTTKAHGPLHQGGLAIQVAEMALISTEGAYHHIHPWTCRLKCRDKVVVFVTIQALAWYPERALAERLRRCNADLV